MSGDFLLIHSWICDVMDAIFLFFSTFYSHVLLSRNLICNNKSSWQAWVFPDQMRVGDIFLAACTKEAETVLPVPLRLLALKRERFKVILKFRLLSLGSQTKLHGLKRRLKHRAVEEGFLPSCFLF